jgi:hypothetical protein
LRLLCRENGVQATFFHVLIAKYTFEIGKHAIEINKNRLEIAEFALENGKNALEIAEFTLEIDKYKSGIRTYSLNNPENVSCTQTQNERKRCRQQAIQ